MSTADRPSNRVKFLPKCGSTFNGSRIHELKILKIQPEFSRLVPSNIFIITALKLPDSPINRWFLRYVTAAMLVHINKRNFNEPFLICAPTWPSWPLSFESHRTEGHVSGNHL